MNVANEAVVPKLATTDRKLLEVSQIILVVVIVVTVVALAM